MFWFNPGHVHFNSLKSPTRIDFSAFNCRSIDFSHTDFDVLRWKKFKDDFVVLENYLPLCNVPLCYYKLSSLSSKLIVFFPSFLCKVHMESPVCPLCQSGFVGMPASWSLFKSFSWGKTWSGRAEPCGVFQSGFSPSLLLESSSDFPQNEL